MSFKKFNFEKHVVQIKRIYKSLFEICHRNCRNHIFLAVKLELVESSCLGDGRAQNQQTLFREQKIHFA